MAWQPTTGLQLSGYRFLRRRIECALMGRDLRTVNEPMRAPAQSLVAGLAFAVVLLLGCVAVALLRPQPAAGTAPIVMEQHSGALYVRVGETLHPVLNLASARLIAKTNADPQPITASALSRSRLGALLGIPGAPQFLGRPLGDDDSQWTVCDGREATTVLVGRVDDAAWNPLSPGQTLLVTPSSGGSTYLLFDGRRAVVNLRDGAVSRALGLDGEMPRPVSPVLLNLIPETPPITAPRIPDAGKHGPGPLLEFPVGSVVRVTRAGGDEYYVVLRDGVQRVGQVAADLLRFANSQGTRTAITVAPDVVRAAKAVTSLPVSDFPDRAQRPLADRPSLCTSWRRVASGGVEVSFSAGPLPIPVGRQPVTLAQSDGKGSAVDAVYLPPGRMSYVRAANVAGTDARPGTRYVIADTGVRFTVHDDEAAHDLGLPGMTVVAPWPVLAALPAGPDLSRAEALVAQDIPAVARPAAGS
jgi:type VII secretion protein EccB